MQPAWPAPARAWWTVAVLTFTYIVSFVDRTILGLLIEPIKVDLALNDTEIGLHVAGTDNLIIRNSARANSTNYTITGGNELAPIVTNPGSNGFADAKPWSNFAY